MQLFVGLELIGATRRAKEGQAFEDLVDQLLENAVFTQKWVYTLTILYNVGCYNIH